MARLAPEMTRLEKTRTGFALNLPSGFGAPDRQAGEV
jgi:hypothetical protein